MSHMMQPQIVLLREGTDTSQGKGQLISNINACQAIADSIRSTLGPRGMDKLVFDGHGVTISNDGATIMKLLDVVHPAAKMLVDVSMSQDAEVGDGTTSVVLLASEFLKQAKPFIEDGVHPQIIVRAYRRASIKAVDRIKELAIGVDASDPEGTQKMLERCAATALNSKLISQQQDFFAPMVVKCVQCLDPNDMDIVANVGVKKVPGGSVTDSFLVEGVAFKKTFSYAGFEQQTKNFDNPKVLLLNIELELKSEKENAEIRITDPAQYQSIVDAEWNIIYEKLAKCVESGANIILSKLPIGDLATQYFADRGLFCAGRVEAADLTRTCLAVGGTVQTTVNNMSPDVLGTCGHFEERQVGDERFNIFTQCPKARTSTIVLRGGAEQFIEESHRSVHDALMIVKRCIQSQSIVAGGGAIEMEMSMELRKMALNVEGKAQMVIQAFAKALEVVPRQLADNAGFDATNVLNLLRAKHFKEPEAGKWFGVDCSTGGICDTFEAHIWEPSANKVNSIASACEAACMILSVDETIRNPASEQMEGKGKGKGGKGGKGLGLGNLSAAMGGAGMMGMGKGGKGGGLGRGVRAFRGRGGA